MFREFREENSEVADKAEETADLLSGCGRGPSSDTVSFALIRFDAFGGDAVPEKFDFFAKECGFLRVAIKSVVSEGVEDCRDVLFVIRQRAGPDHNVVQVNVTYLANVRSKCRGYPSLVYSRSVFDAHGHYDPFI